MSLKALTNWSCNRDTGFFCNVDYKFFNTIYKDFMLERVEKGKVKESLRMWRGVTFVSFQQRSSLYLKQGILSRNLMSPIFPLNRFLEIQI
jgi:hypothetical protein